MLLRLEEEFLKFLQKILTNIEISSRFTDEPDITSVYLLEWSKDSE